MVVLYEWLEAIDLGYLIERLDEINVSSPQQLLTLSYNDFCALGVQEMTDRKKLFSLQQRIRVALDKKRAEVNGGNQTDSDCEGVVKGNEGGTSVAFEDNEDHVNQMVDVKGVSPMPNELEDNSAPRGNLSVASKLEPQPQSDNTPDTHPIHRGHSRIPSLHNKPQQQLKQQLTVSPRTHTRHDSIGTALSFGWRGSMSDGGAGPSDRPRMGIRRTGSEKVPNGGGVERRESLQTGGRGVGNGLRRSNTTRGRISSARPSSDSVRGHGRSVSALPPPSSATSAAPPPPPSPAREAAVTTNSVHRLSHQPSATSDRRTEKVDTSLGRRNSGRRSVGVVAKGVGGGSGGIDGRTTAAVAPKRRASMGAPSSTRNASVLSTTPTGVGVGTAKSRRSSGAVASVATAAARRRSGAHATSTPASPTASTAVLTSPTHTTQRGSTALGRSPTARLPQSGPQPTDTKPSASSTQVSLLLRDSLVTAHRAYLKAMMRLMKGEVSCVTQAGGLEELHWRAKDGPAAAGAESKREAYVVAAGAYCDELGRALEGRLELLSQVQAGVRAVKQHLSPAQQRVAELDRVVEMDDERSSTTERSIASSRCAAGGGGGSVAAAAPPPGVAPGSKLDLLRARKRQLQHRSSVALLANKQGAAPLVHPTTGGGQDYYGNSSVGGEQQQQSGGVLGHAAGGEKEYTSPATVAAAAAARRRRMSKRDENDIAP